MKVENFSSRHPRTAYKKHLFLSFLNILSFLSRNWSVTIWVREWGRIRKRIRRKIKYGGGRGKGEAILIKNIWFWGKKMENGLNWRGKAGGVFLGKISSHIVRNRWIQKTNIKGEKMERTVVILKPIVPCSRCWAQGFWAFWWIDNFMNEP